MALSEKFLEYALDDPQRTVAMGRSALGYLANAVAPEEPGKPPLMVPVTWAVGAAVIAFGLAAWMSAPGTERNR